MASTVAGWKQAAAAAATKAAAVVATVTVFQPTYRFRTARARHLRRGLSAGAERRGARRRRLCPLPPHPAVRRRGGCASPAPPRLGLRQGAQGRGSADGGGPGRRGRTAWGVGWG